MSKGRKANNPNNFLHLLSRSLWRTCSYAKTLLSANCWAFLHSADWASEFISEIFMASLKGYSTSVQQSWEQSYFAKIPPWWSLRQRSDKEIPHTGQNLSKREKRQSQKWIGSKTRRVVCVNSGQMRNMERWTIAGQGNKLVMIFCSYPFLYIFSAVNYLQQI